MSPSVAPDRSAKLLSWFSKRQDNSAVGLGKEPDQAHHEKARATLLAMKEFKQYLEGIERDLIRTSKKFSNKEIAQGVQLATTGIHEALHYVTIVGKVIEKTERIVAKRSNSSDSSTLPTGETLL